MLNINEMVKKSPKSFNTFEMHFIFTLRMNVNIMTLICTRSTQSIRHYAFTFFSFLEFFYLLVICMFKEFLKQRIIYSKCRKSIFELKL